MIAWSTQEMDLSWISIQELEWDEKKSQITKQKHGKSLEEIALHIRAGKAVAFFEHPNQKKYPGQWLIVLDLEGYPWVVPCEFRGNKLRLVTAFPNRNFKNLLRGKK